MIRWLDIRDDGDERGGRSGRRPVGENRDGGFREVGRVVDPVIELERRLLAGTCKVGARPRRTDLARRRAIRDELVRLGELLVDGFAERLGRANTAGLDSIDEARRYAADRLLFAGVVIALDLAVPDPSVEPALERGD